MYGSRSGPTQRRLVAGAAVLLTAAVSACSSSSNSSPSAASPTTTAPAAVAPTSAASPAAVAPTSAVAPATTGAAAPSSTTATSAAPAATNITLKVQDYYNYEPDQTIYGKVLNQCGADNGIKINREVIPGDSFIPKILQEGSSKNLPDVLMLDNPDLQQIAATGALTPLSDYGLTADGMIAGVAAASTYKGTLYGLQPVTNTIGLFYNKDLLAKAGVTPPTTWAELETAAKKLSSGGVYGIAFAAKPSFEGTWTFTPFMWSNGGDEKNIATQQTADALQLWVDLVKSGGASKSVITYGQGDVADQFKAGKAAMMINGPWNIPGLDAVKGLNYGAVPIPVPTAGGKLVGPLGGETWTVPNTGNKDKEAAAAKIVACLYSDKNQLLLGKERQTIPTKTSLQAQFNAANPALKIFSDIVVNARSRTGELGADWPKAATKIYTAIQTAITGGSTPLKALQTAQNG